MNKSKGLIFLFAGLASLTLIIAVAYFWFSREQAPKTATTPTTVTPATTPVPDTFDPVEWSRQPQTATDLKTPGAAGGAGTSTTTPNGTTDTPDGGFVVTMPKDGATTPTKPAVDFPSETPKSTSTVDFPEAKSTPVAKAPVKTPAKAPQTKPVAKAPAKATKTVTEYWIQVGAFKDRYQADAVSKTLENQGLKGTLTTATVAGNQVVRVRVGPYTNQDEAKKFLAWVSPVKGLEAAYITATKATRTE